MYKVAQDVLPKSYFRVNQTTGCVRSAGPNKKKSQNKDEKSALTWKEVIFRVPTAPVTQLRQVPKAFLEG